jgi:hypothetical protein
MEVIGCSLHPGCAHAGVMRLGSRQDVVTNPRGSSVLKQQCEELLGLAEQGFGSEVACAVSLHETR